MTRNLVLLFIVIASTALADTFTSTISRPSNRTGYNLVSFPVLPNQPSWRNTIGTQLDDTYITLYYHEATTGYLRSMRASGGVDTTFRREAGYYAVIRDVSPETHTVTVTGNACNDPFFNMGTIYTGFNLISSIWLLPVPLTQTNLVVGTSRFTGGTTAASSDQIRTLVNGVWKRAWYHTISGWQGDFTSLEPGRAYFILRRTGRPAFQWSDYPNPNR